MKNTTPLLAICAFTLLLACSPAKPAAPPAKAPDEMAAIEAVRKVTDAQTNFMQRTRRYAQTFAELISGNLLPAEPTKADTGYDFLLLPSPDAIHYTVTATPTAPGARYFFADETGVIRAEKDKPATAGSPQL